MATEEEEEELQLVLRTVTCNGKRGLLRPLILVVVNRRGRVPCRVRHYSDVVRRSELLPDSIHFIRSQCSRN
jgi:hypothetical protein